MDVISLPSILKHGATLKTLQLHERETMEIDVARGLLDVDDVRKIRKACPRLQDLTMDIDREAEKWEDEEENPKIYHELALFGPQLNKIQLYFNLGIAAQIVNVHTPVGRLASPVAGEDLTTVEVSSDSEFANSDDDDQPQKKRLKQDRLSARDRALLPLPEPEHASAYVKNIWHTIFGGRTTGGRALDVKVGEWERKMGRGYPAPWVLWEQSARSYIMLRPHERDDMREEVVVTCQGGLQGKL